MEVKCSDYPFCADTSRCRNFDVSYTIYSYYLLIMDVADEWVATVRDLKDAEKENGEEPYAVECICRDILRYVRVVRIREVGRFKQRTGLEYEAFIESLSGFKQELLQRIIMDDSFWDATIGMVGK
jgi:hypothetical protein